MIAEFENVEVALSKSTVLSNLNWQIPKGKVIGLLGKNGVGKSTLIRTLLGLIPTDSGRVDLFGKNPRGMGDEEKSRLAYVPQTAMGYEGLKVKAAVSLHASCYESWDDEIAERMLTKFEIHSDKKVGKLSVGQRQALMLVFALASQPEFLIMDEPLASLDPAARREVLQFVAETAGTGCTILYSTHITADLVRLADDIAMLAEGNIQFCQDSQSLSESVLLSGPLPPALLEHPDFSSNVLARNKEMCIASNWDEKFRSMLSDETLVSPLNLEELFIRWHAIKTTQTEEA